MNTETLLQSKIFPTKPCIYLNWYYCNSEIPRQCCYVAVLVDMQVSTKQSLPPPSQRAV